MSAVRTRRFAWTRLRERGQGLVEYAMIISMIVIVVIAILTFVGSALFQQMYSRIGSAMPVT